MTRSRQFTKAEQETIDTLKRLPWSAHFHKTINNPSAPCGKVDMYLIVDDESGEGIVSLGVPHGQGFIADWIAGCCANPWWVKQLEADNMIGMAQVMNRALSAFIEDDKLDGYSVSLAALTIFEAYMAALPKHARNELANRMLATVNRWAS